jgi:hypothetical protein
MDKVNDLGLDNLRSNDRRLNDLRYYKDKLEYLNDRVICALHIIDEVKDELSDIFYSTHEKVFDIEDAIANEVFELEKEKVING